MPWQRQVPAVDFQTAEKARYWSRQLQANSSLVRKMLSVSPLASIGRCPLKLFFITYLLAARGWMEYDSFSLPNS